MTALRWMHLWRRLARTAASRCCHFTLAAWDDYTEASQRDWLCDRARAAADLHRRALQRSDEALSRVSPLRVVGGAS